MTGNSEVHLASIRTLTVGEAAVLAGAAGCPAGFGVGARCSSKGTDKVPLPAERHPRHGEGAGQRDSSWPLSSATSMHSSIGSKPGEASREQGRQLRARSLLVSANGEKKATSKNAKPHQHIHL